MCHRTSRSQMGIAQHGSAGFGSRQGILGALGNHFPLVLSHRGQDIHRQLAGVRIIDRNEFGASLNQRGDECQIAGQPIEFGDDQFGLVPLASGERRGELRARDARSWLPR
jgi:hypothetical protein